MTLVMAKLVHQVIGNISVKARAFLCKNKWEPFQFAIHEWKGSFENTSLKEVNE